MVKHLILILFSLSLCFGGASNSHASPELRRGINLASWFANAAGRQQFNKNDFTTIKELGFDYVRLPVNPDYLGASLSDNNIALDRYRLAKLDKAIEDIQATGLDILLDLHPEPEFHQILERSDSAHANFVLLWKMLAEHYAHIPQNRMAFEILNEPRFAKHADGYANLITRTVQAIRDIDRDRTLIINLPWVKSLNPIDSLAALPHIQDTKIIYGIHFYQPYIITHQGMPFGFEKQSIYCFRDIPYPIDPFTHIMPDLTHCANKEAAAKEAADYVNQNWNAEHLRKLLTPVAEWAKANDKRVLVLEFGVYRPYIDPASRYRWIRDARQVMDDLNLGWAYWDYGDVFGITTLSEDKTVTSPRDGSVRFEKPSDSRNRRMIEPEAIYALGLSTLQQPLHE